MKLPDKREVGSSTLPRPITLILLPASGPICEEADRRSGRPLYSGKSSNDYGRTMIAAMVSATMQALTVGPSQFA
jgi:hypothetical protein